MNEAMSQILTPRRLLIIAIPVGITLVVLASIRLVARAHHADTPVAAAPQAEQQRPDRGILRFIYLRDVECDRDQDRRFKMNITVSGSHDVYTFLDKHTYRTFHDGAYLKAQFAKLVAAGIARRAGAFAYQIPDALRQLTNLKTVYLTPAQKQAVLKIGQEARDWQSLLANSPVILTDADVKPNVTVHMGGLLQQIPAVSTQFTPDGKRKFAEFTTSHTHEIMGILIDGRLVSAPIIEEPIVDGWGEIAGGFSMAEARALANRLNGEAPNARSAETSMEAQKNYPIVTPVMLRENISASGYTGIWTGSNAQVVVNDPAAETVPEAPGYQTTLSSGYAVGIDRITRPADAGKEWDASGARWWNADGVLLPSRGGRSLHSMWTFSKAKHPRAAPYIIESGFVSRQAAQSQAPNDVSTYEEFIVNGSRLELDGGPAFFRMDSAGTSILPLDIPEGIRTCAIRFGVAAGPWRTAGTLPAHFARDLVAMPVPNPRDYHDAATIKLDDKPALMYQDKNGVSHTEYFLGEAGQLGNVARRIVAVDADGNVIPLRPTRYLRSKWPVPLIGLPFADNAPMWADPGVGLSKVKEFRLETRPYETVEFRNVQLQPRGGKAGASPQAAL